MTKNKKILLLILLLCFSLIVVFISARTVISPTSNQHANPDLSECSFDGDCIFTSTIGSEGNFKGCPDCGTRIINKKFELTGLRSDTNSCPLLDCYSPRPDGQPACIKNHCKLKK